MYAINNVLLKKNWKHNLFFIFHRGLCTNKIKEKPLVLISNNDNIHFNLSLENFLLCNYNDLMKYLGTKTIEKFHQPLLFLWRNNRCIIVGKNQNVWSECNLNNVNEDNVLMARRFSGGGAVYHDLGNLCFTFLNSNSNIENNYEIILNGLKKHFNITATTRGRNDLVINDKKFSGSAYKKIKDVHLHHGTILINLDRSVLNKYLTPDKVKYIKHGVSSVNARTMNLVEVNPNITHEKVCYALIDSFLDFYEKNKKQENGIVDIFFKDKENEKKNSADLIYINDKLSSQFNVYYIDKNEKIIKNPEFLKYYNLLKDWDWCYGKTPKFQNRISNHFNFGKIEIHFNISNGVIKEGDVFSDCLDIQLIDEIKNIFNRDIKYTKENVMNFFNNLKVENKEIIDEIARWIIQEI